MLPAEQNSPAQPMKIHTVQAIRKIAFYVVAAVGVSVVAVIGLGRAKRHRHPRID